MLNLSQILNKHLVISQVLDIRPWWWILAGWHGKKDKAKTAYVKRKKLFKFKVISFGVTCAPEKFERLTGTVFAGIQWDIFLVYLDDIKDNGNSENMLEILGKVFNKLQQAGLKFKAKKCSLLATKVKNLDHMILHVGIATDPNKFAAVA